MKELFNIYVFHEYDKGICPHIQLRPFPQLWEFEKNKHMQGRRKSAQGLYKTYKKCNLE